MYDSAARGDATPVRVLRLDDRGFRGVYGFEVDGTGNLYVGSDMDPFTDAGSVAVFEAGANGNAKPLRVIAGPRTGLRRPAEVAVDRRGYVYVTNQGTGRDDDSVRVFDAASTGDVEACRTIGGERTGLDDPQGMAIDRQGRLYVANAAHGGGSTKTVTVYDVGSTGDAAPIRMLTGRGTYDGLTRPRRLAFGSQDSLYVRSVISFSVFSLELPDSEPARSFKRYAPDLFALDRHDTMYVVWADTVKVYAPGYSGVEAAVRWIAGPRSGVRGVTGIALNDRGWLYLAKSDSSLIREYAPGASGDVAPTRTLAGDRTRLANPLGITLDRSGRLYVTNGPQPGRKGNIRVYAPGAHGEDPPVRMLAGPKTRLGVPTKIEFDRHGDMYVVTAGLVAVYRQLADGNEAPLRTIEGPESLLRGPAALAFGRGDTLYALNIFGSPSLASFEFLCSRSFENATVTAYPPGSSGDAEPVHYIVLVQNGKSPGSTLGMSSVRNIAVDTSGAVEVWVRGGAVVYAPGANGEVAPVRTIPERVEAGSDPAAVISAGDGTVYQATVPIPFRLTGGPCM